MGTEYDVFEILLNRSVQWHVCVRGKQRALDMLKAVGSRTFNECFATDLGTRQVIGRVNSGSIVARSIVEDHRATASQFCQGRKPCIRTELTLPFESS